jgi:MFS family permease
LASLRLSRITAFGPPDPQDVRPLRFPGLFAFVGSGCLLVLELVAGRILAPTIGNSLYTWTSVIGVVLAGLSLGNWLGGKIADRRPGRSVLSLLYLASAVASGLILVLSRNLDSVAAPYTWSAILQVLWLTVILFFLPSVLLGTITPMIVKLTLSSLDVTGQVVGRIQAAATLGSIVGVFATGYWLISAFGTRAVVAGVTVALLALAVFSNPVWEAKGRESKLAGNVGIASLLVLMATAVLTVTYDSPCTRESNYYCIQVLREGDFKLLALDQLIHGYVSITDPSQPVYGYERVYRDMIDTKWKGKRAVRGFGIGGGAFTFPRYLERYHRGYTIVAEIDKEVTDIAHKDFYLKDSPGIKIINKDARPVLRDRPKGELYDVILGDAYGDLAIPYHLVTKEFDRLVASRLNPDGMFLANIIDGVHYDFLRSFIHTAKQVFPYVDLVAVPGESGGGARATFVVAASRQPLPRIASTASPPQLAAFMTERKPTLLTDNHVPVDQLLAPVFRQRLQEHQGESVQPGT